MSWVAVAIAGSGALGAGASLYGASQQAGAAGDAAGMTWQQYQDTLANMQPYLKSGKMALSELDKGLFGPGQSLLAPFDLQKFQADPGYNFQLEQGMNAINKGAAARGNYYAPQTLQDLGKFQQGLAGTQFQNAYNRYTGDQQRQFNMLHTISGSGQNAAAGAGALGADAARTAGGFMTDAAGAEAGGYMGAANALGGAGLGLAGYQQYLAGLQGGNYGSTSLRDIGQNGPSWY